VTGSSSWFHVALAFMRALCAPDASTGPALLGRVAAAVCGVQVASHENLRKIRGKIKNVGAPASSR